MNICDLFKELSIDTWHRIKFARERIGFKIYETTITQNILITVEKFRIQNSIRNIRMFESIDESSNGNDIELYIQSESGEYIFFPVQAKIIVHSNKSLKDGKYAAFKGSQFDSLKKYAITKKGIPIYLFYNYSSHIGDPSFGCLVYRASDLEVNFYDYIRAEWKKFKFSELISEKKGVKWENLVCKKLRIIKNKDTGSISIVDNRFSESNIKLYNSEELIFDDNWKEIGREEQKRNITPKTKRKKNKIKFNPMFRMIINNYSTNPISESENKSN